MRRVWSAARFAVAVCLTAAVCLSVGVATGAIPGSDGRISACYTKFGGVLRVIDTERIPADKCTSLERALSWNQAGQPGPAGPRGPQGQPGPSLDSFGQLDGLTCTRNGQAGHTSVDVSGDGAATIRCNYDAPPPPADADLRLSFVRVGTEDAIGLPYLVVRFDVVNDGPAAAGGVNARLTFTGSPDAGYPRLYPPFSSPECTGTLVVDCALGAMARGEISAIIVALEYAHIGSSQPPYELTTTISLQATSPDPNPANGTQTIGTLIEH